MLKTCSHSHPITNLSEIEENLLAYIKVNYECIEILMIITGVFYNSGFLLNGTYSTTTDVQKIEKQICQRF